MNAFTSFWSLKFVPWFLNALPNLLRAIFVVVLVAVLTKLLPKIIDRIWKKAHGDNAVKSYVRASLKVVLWALALIVLLDLVGFPIGSLLTVVAAVGAAVALAIKDNLSNIASGVVLLFTKPFKAGDFIEVDGVSGTVREIELMRTYIDTVTNTRACVPNTKMVTATIVNYSEHDFRRQDLMFSIGYNQDINRAREVILATAKANKLVCSVPEDPMVVVTEHSDSAIVLMLRFWCAQPDFFPAKYSLNEQVKLAFDQAGIEIPYPHMEVVGLSAAR